jgi:hypothetical protein
LVAGGLLGSLLTVRKVGGTALRILTALLILFVAAQLTRRFLRADLVTLVGFAPAAMLAR